MTSSCGHTRVASYPLPNNDGTQTEVWACIACGAPFQQMKVEASTSETTDYRTELERLERDINAEVERARTDETAAVVEAERLGALLDEAYKRISAVHVHRGPVRYSDCADCQVLEHIEAEREHAEPGTTQ